MTAKRAWAELEVQPTGERQWFISGEVGISSMYREGEDPDADLAAALLKAFRQAQAFSR